MFSKKYSILKWIIGVWWTTGRSVINNEEWYMINSVKWIVYKELNKLNKLK